MAVMHEAAVYEYDLSISYYSVKYSVDQQSCAYTWVNSSIYNAVTTEVLTVLK